MYQRQILILKELFSSSGTVSGITLSRATSLSLKTIRKEIGLINNDLKSYKIKIISITGEGYRIEADNEEAFRTYKSKILDICNRRLYFTDDQQNRVHYIIRRLLTKEDRLCLEDLADECFVSKSLINRDMTFVKKELARYDIEVVNQTKKGIQVIANEWNVRTLLISEHKIFLNYSEAIVDGNDYLFEKAFEVDDESVEKIKAILLDEIIRLKVYVPRNNFRKVIIMIILAINRKEYVNRIHFTNEQMDSIERKASYKVTENVCRRLSEVGFHFERNDIISIAIYILCVATIKLENLRNFQNYHNQIVESKLILNHVKTIIPNWHAFNALQIEEFACVYVSLKRRHRYKVYLDSDSVLGFEEDGLLILDVCIIVIQYLKRSGIEVDIYEALQLYYIFSNTASSGHLNKERKYKKILVFSHSGFYAAKKLVRDLENIFYKSDIVFKSVEYIDLFSINTSEYDLLLTDFFDTKIRSLDIEKMEIQLFRTVKEIQEVATKLEEHAIFNSNTIFKNDDVYMIGKIKNKHDLYRFIENEVLLKYPRKEEFIKECKEKEAYFPLVKKHQIAVLRSLNDCLGESLLRIIIPDKPFDWNDKTCRLIILYNVKNNEYTELQYMNKTIAKILHELPPILEPINVENIKKNVLKIL